MRLVAYSRRKLERTTDVDNIVQAVRSCFGEEGLRFAPETESPSDEGTGFDLKEAYRKLQHARALTLFKMQSVWVNIDNQDFYNQYFIHPHSTITVELMKEDALGMAGWLKIADHLTETIPLELALVLGPTETVGDYRRTPLGVGIGLIKVFWIMCFGSTYSQLIPEPREATKFFKRVCKPGSKAFVSTETYEQYVEAASALLDSQKNEVGRDLFHRLPLEQPMAGGAQCLLSPATIFGLLKAFYHEKMTDWRRFQAREVPEVYRKKS